MTPDGDVSSTLSPDEAFSALGNEVRMDILRALAEADDRLAFSELYDRVDVADSGQFSYHLDKLVNHFVRKTADGYDLHQAGRRVIEAVLSGAITDRPTIDRTAVDHSCFYCGAQMEVSYRQGQIGMYCTECRGQYEGATAPDAPAPPSERERIGYLELPPAGVQGRSPAEALDAAYTWYYNQVLTIASGVCPRCSAPLDYSVRICDDHEPTDGVCDQCGNRNADRIHYRCTNCIVDRELGLSNHFLDEATLHAFMIDNGVDVVSPSVERLFATVGEVETEVRSTDPFEATLRFTVDEETLAVSVDDELTVVDATRL